MLIDSDVINFHFSWELAIVNSETRPITTNSNIKKEEEFFMESTSLSNSILNYHFIMLSTINTNFN